MRSFHLFGSLALLMALFLLASAQIAPDAVPIAYKTIWSVCDVTLKPGVVGENPLPLYAGQCYTSGSNGIQYTACGSTELDILLFFNQPNCSGGSGVVAHQSTNVCNGLTGNLDKLTCGNPIPEPVSIPIETPTETPTFTPVDAPETIPIEEPQTVPFAPIEPPTESPSTVPTSTPINDTNPVSTPIVVPTEEPIAVPSTASSFIATTPLFTIVATICAMICL